jgi:hypothetical protein
MKWGFHVFQAVNATLLLGLLGCSGAEVAGPPAAASRAELTELLTTVNAPCPGLGIATPSPPSARDQLFVEAVILDVSSEAAEQVSLTTLQDLPKRAPVQLVGTPHLIADFGHSAELARGPGELTPEQLSLRRWSLLPRRADRGTVLEVEVELEPPTSAPGTGRPRRTLKFAATARENEPTLARVEWDKASRRSLLLLFRTFEVRGQEELRAIFQCKMQQRAQWLARHRQSP